MAVGSPVQLDKLSCPAQLVQLIDLRFRLC